MLHMAPPNWTEDEWRHFCRLFWFHFNPPQKKLKMSFHHHRRDGWTHAFRTLLKNCKNQTTLKKNSNKKITQWYPMPFSDSDGQFKPFQEVGQPRRHSLQNGSKWRLRNMWGPDLDRWNADTQFTKWQLENSTLFYTNIHFMLCFFDLFWPFWWIRTVL